MENKNKIKLKKRLIIRLIVTAVISLLFSAGYSDVFAITKGNDEIYISSPVNNSVVSGTQTVSFFTKDSDKVDLPYQVDLFSNNCSANGSLFGIVESGTKQTSQYGTTLSVSWDTDGPIQNRASISDGVYCLRVCATFREYPNNYYSLCDKKTVTISNTNKPPVINSKPKNTSVQVGTDYSYDVNASDPDGDKLVYSIDKDNSFFLSINPDTGLLETNNNSFTVGNYDITISVKDGRGGVATQKFTLNVTDTPVSNSSEIVFIEPTSNTTFTKDNNIVKWSVGSKKVSSISLFVEDQNSNWQQIGVIQSSDREYEWDVSNYNSGSYRLKLVIIDDEGEKIETISDSFNISTDSDGGEKAAVISPVNPGIDTITSDKNPVIRVQVSPAEGSTVDASGVNVSLNDETLEDCTFINSEIECNLDGDLTNGKHKIVVKVEDSNGVVSTKEWTFLISEISPDSSPDSGPDSLVEDPFANLSPDTTNLIILILLCGGLLLVGSWILYMIILRRGRNNYAADNYPQSDDTYSYGGSYSEPSPLVPNPDVPAYQAPSSNTGTYSDENYQSSIGTQTLDMGTEYTEPVKVDDEFSLDNFDSPEVEMPSIYSDDEEIPDWLKTTDTSSSPVAPEGSTFADGSDEGSNPYGSYGLGSQNES